MSTQPRAGEMLVGAHLKWIQECEIIAYGEHSQPGDKQMEIDVMGVRPNDGQEVIVCEVATHIQGLGYGTARQNRDKVASKFRNATEYVTQVFPSAASYKFQFWSPRVGPKPANLLEEFAADFDEELELVMNEKYTKKIWELQERAASTTSQQNELAFRILQIMGHLEG